PNLANNTASTTTPVLTGADLGITLSHAASFTAGSTGVFTLVVSNAGPAPASDAVVVLQLPHGLTFSSGSGCSAVAGASDSTVSCAIGALAAGRSRTVSVVVAVGPDVTGSATVTAVATSSSADPVGANNTVADIADVISSAIHN
ncbi:MAG: conserved repeat domain protein, partial [Jatrophihabitantaceae bacterium]|nr:conserved repeat domain protein [Jatrophihabitantaceae bacterium]